MPAVVGAARLCVLVLFGVLTAKSSTRARRSGEAAAWWLAASFAVLALVTLAGVLFHEELDRADGRPVYKATVALLLLFPYCLHRFTASFGGSSRRRDALCSALTATALVATVALPAQPAGALGQPAWYPWFAAGLLLEWTTLSLLSATSLWRRGQGQPTVVRRRMRTLSLGSLMVNLGVLVLGSAPPSLPPFQLVVQVLGMASAWLFFLGFAPPAWLRTLWRQRELELCRAAEGQLLAALDDEAVARIIVPQALALLGGRFAVMAASDGLVLASVGITPGEAADVVGRLGPASEGDHGRVGEATPRLLALALRGGWLVVQASPATPFLGREEVGLLESLGHSAELALERASLFERERTSRRVLEERESQLAQAQRLARVGSWEWHLGSGRVVWSEEMYRIYDLAPADLEGDADYRWFQARSHPDDRAAMEEAVRGALASGDPFELDHRLVGPGGGVTWLRSRGRVVMDEAGTPERLQGTAQEITAEKESERQLEARAHQQAVIAQLGQRALEGLDLAGLLAEMADAVSRVLSVDRVGVFEVMEGGASLLLRSGTGWGDGALGGLTLPAGPSCWPGSALTNAGPEVGEGRAALVIPGHGAPFGLLTVEASTPRPFGSADVDFLTSAANVLAGAIGRHRNEVELAHQALHDPLTGLPNRALLMDRLGQAATRAARQPGLLAVLFLDLDRFKVVNDGLGHGAGDDLLRAVARRLADAVRPSDTVARFGGDEFVILCENVTDEHQAVLVAHRVAEGLSRPIRVAGRDVTISASVGVVLADAGLASPEALLRDADTAMYQAKERGRARSEVFDATTRQRVLDRLETEVALHGALERDELRLWYQPEVSLVDGSIVGLEALLRWQHPERGLQLPGQFLGLAEETGLIVPIGHWALREACRQAQVWRQAPGWSSLVMWVNLSARQLAQPDLVAVIATTLGDTGTDPTLLGVEITESVLMEDVDALGDTLRALSELGVRLAIDDFGTGFSSLSWLHRFSVDVLKIDRSFVAGVTGTEGDLAIVGAVVGLARSMGMQAVAEGVETPAQVAALRALGCGAAQGFHFAAPMDQRAMAAVVGAADASRPDASRPQHALSG